MSNKEDINKEWRKVLMRVALDFIKNRMIWAFILCIGILVIGELTDHFLIGLIIATAILSIFFRKKEYDEV